MRTIQIPKSPAYGANLKRFGGADSPCVVCGRPCPNPKQFVHVIDGGLDTAVHPDDDCPPDDGDMGFYPIGADCLKQHPQLKPFTIAQ